MPTDQSSLIGSPKNFLNKGQKKQNKTFLRDTKIRLREVLIRFWRGDPNQSLSKEHQSNDWSSTIRVVWRMSFWSLCPSFPLDFRPYLTGEGEEGTWQQVEWRCSYWGSFFLPQIIMFIFNEIMKGFLKRSLILGDKINLFEINSAISNKKSGVQTEPGSHQFSQWKQVLSGRLKGPTGAPTHESSVLGLNSQGLLCRSQWNFQDGWLMAPPNTMWKTYHSKTSLLGLLQWGGDTLTES